MKIDIEEVVKSSLTIEDVLVLMELEYGRRGKFFPYSSTREEQYISLYKRGVLNSSPEGYTISVEGFQELRQIIGERPLELKNKVKESDFEAFWKAYPVSDAHGQWLRTRNLKSDKARCIKYYKKAITNGTSHEDIMKALKWEVRDRQTNSVKTNRMSYMKNSAAWLYQKEYEIINESIQEEETLDKGDWTENTV